MTTASTTDARLRLPSLEDWLDAHGVTWTLDPAVPLDSIDIHAGLVNQVRHEPIDPDTVDRYADDIRAGDVFPAIVLRDVDGRRVPIGGNHRLAGHFAAGSTTIAAYRIVCDDVTADLAAYQDNRHHGKPTTLQENVSHAMRLHLHSGLPISEAARAAGVNRIHLDHRLGAERAADRAQRLGITGYTKIEKGAGNLEFRKLGVRTRYDLGRIVDPDVFRRTVELVLERVIPSSSVPALATRLNDLDRAAARNLLEELEAAEEGRVRNTAGRPHSPRTHPAHALRHQLDQIMRHEPSDVVADCPTPEQRALTAGQIRAAARKLMLIGQTLEAASAPHLRAVAP